MTLRPSSRLSASFWAPSCKGTPIRCANVANADYIQHNPFIPTGLEPFIELLPVLAEAGTTAENIRMFEDGNYVFMHNIWRNAAPFGADQMVSFDIIRVDENGKGRGTLGCVAAPGDGNRQRPNPDRRSNRSHRSGQDRGQQGAGRGAGRGRADGQEPGQDHRLHQRRELCPAQPTHRGRAERDRRGRSRR
jgi:predicted SnoaL-like aldol condensation-catalyzing enzyme